MDTRRLFLRTVSIFLLFMPLGTCWLFLSACGNSEQSTPTSITYAVSPTETGLTSEYPTITPFAAINPSLPTATSICTDNLLFVGDVTIPDGTVVSPGSSLDKQWLVQNNGECNWDVRYRLRLIGGDALGASVEQALYPARSGTQVNLRILFTAPQEIGEYVSEWQAYNEYGVPFGEIFFIKIIVEQ
jgi:hypothetical protein